MFRPQQGNHQGSCIQRNTITANSVEVCTVNNTSIRFAKKLFELKSVTDELQFLITFELSLSTKSYINYFHPHSELKPVLSVSVDATVDFSILCMVYVLR